jgi:AraC family transcriptional regulator
MDYISIDIASARAPFPTWAQRKCAPHRTETVECHRHAILNAINSMRKDPSGPHDLARMAATACMSRYHFLRVFEEATQISPGRFLAALRMQQAKRLLLETSIPVTTICFAVGYNSLGTFTRLFTDCVGVSPSSYRKLIEALAGHSIEALIESYFRRQVPLRSQRIVSGFVHGPADFQGVVFVGAFSSPIPQQQPIDGSLLLHPGRFELALEPGVQPRCLMAAGFPANSDAISYLLPSPEQVLVASTPLSCEISGDSALRDRDLILRPLQPFDPPILTALPILLEH